MIHPSLPRSDGWALALLLLAMATVGVSGSDRGYLETRGRDHVTRNHLTIAANLSPEHGFLGFYHRFLNEDGEIAYVVYNRFPLGGHLLIKAAIAPFPDDPAAQIRAARMLMLAFFAAAAVAAFASLRRLTSSSGIALAATLLSFSSFYPLRHADMVATEGSIDLFAVLLAFHGMVVFAQEGRFRQLLVKTCGALLVGWHVYGLVLPFIVFGLASEWYRGRGSGRPWAVRLVRSRHLALGVVALSLGLSVLTLNFAREHDALTGTTPGGPHVRGDEVTLADLPSFRSMVRRLGWDANFNESMVRRLGWDANFNETKHGVAWRALLSELVQRAGRASVPWYAEHVAGHWFPAAVPEEGPSSGKEEITAAAGGVGLDDRSGERGVRSSLDLGKTASFVWGIVVIFVCAAGSSSSPARHRVLMATLAASGFCWGVLARGSVPFFDFEGMFLVGLPLVFFSIVLLRARRISRRLIGVCAGAAVLVFVLSGLQMMERLRLDAEPGSRAEVADYERIRAAVPEGEVIAVNRPKRSRFFLPGRIFVEFRNGRQRHRADFVLAYNRVPGGAGLLTPDNRRVFLYDRAAYDAHYDTLGDSGLEGGRGWRVHLVGDRLLYTTGEACGTKGRFRNEPRFFLEVLDDRGRSRGRRDFGFQDRSFEVAGRCIAELPITRCDTAARIRTGQFIPGEGPLWSAEIPLPGGARAPS